MFECEDLTINARIYLLNPNNHCKDLTYRLVNSLYIYFEGVLVKDEKEYLIIHVL